MEAHAEQVDRRDARRTQVWTAIIAATSPIVVALITLAATGRTISSSSGPSPAPTVTVTVTERPSAGAPSGATPEPGSTSTNQSTAGAAVAVRHQATGVKVSADGSIDLNAPASDPRWSYGDTDGETDTLGYEYGNVYLSGAGYVTLDVKATYKACSTATGYESDAQIDANDLENSKTCLSLTSGRFGTIEVTDHETRGKVTLSLTIWEEP